MPPQAVLKAATPFSCLHCSQKFTQRDAYSSHLNIHSHSPLYQCTRCDKSFRSEALLKKHASTHALKPKQPTATKILPKIQVALYTKCRCCPQKFKHHADLVNHEKLHGTMFCCAICPEVTSSSSGLIKHAEDHLKTVAFDFPKNLFEVSRNSGQPPIRCDICSATLSRPSYFKAHIYRHLNYRPFKCETCDKRFCSNQNLKDHSERHAKDLAVPKEKSPVRINSCNLCSKSYLSRNDLMEHSLVHAEKNHQCKVCRKVFKAKSNLVKHLFIHKIASSSEEASESSREEVQSTSVLTKLLLSPKTGSYEEKSELGIDGKGDQRGAEDLQAKTKSLVRNLFPEEKEVPECNGGEVKSSSVLKVLLSQKAESSEEKSEPSLDGGKDGNLQDAEDLQAKTELHVRNLFPGTESDVPESEELMDTDLEPEKDSSAGTASSDTMEAVPSPGVIAILEKMVVEDVQDKEEALTEQELVEKRVQTPPQVAPQSRRRFSTVSHKNKNPKRAKIEAGSEPKLGIGERAQTLPQVAPQSQRRFSTVSHKNKNPKRAKTETASEPKLGIGERDKTPPQVAPQSGRRSSVDFRGKEDSLHCKICQKSFVIITKLKRHEEVAHALPITFSCDCCSKKCSQYEELVQHQEARHNRNSQWFCWKCEMSFSTKYAWNRHQMKHTRPKSVLTNKDTDSTESSEISE